MRYAPGMQERLTIDLSQLPEDGEQMTGELPAEIFDLPEGDAKATGPLEFDLFVQRFGSELLLTGLLSAPFEFTCVRTLHPFVQTIRLENAAVSLELGNDILVDATEAVREEVLIHFPIDPRCEEGDVPQRCQIDSRYLAVDKGNEDDVETAPRAGTDDRWTALDAIKDLKDQH
jgi:uncharacterized metal-binding protein YceD (DUF177 family)